LIKFVVLDVVFQCSSRDTYREPAMEDVEIIDEDVEPNFDLPIWAWDAASCSLDSTMTAALVLIEALGRDACEQIQDAEFFTILSTWFFRFENSPWQRIPRSEFDKIRNHLRHELTKRGVTVNRDSNIDDSLNLLLPPSIREITFRHSARCVREDCIYDSIELAHKNKTHKKMTTLCHYLNQGPYSSVQEIIRAMVCIPTVDTG
jgi:hypothetical protein